MGRNVFGWVWRVVGWLDGWTGRGVGGGRVVGLRWWVEVGVGGCGGVGGGLYRGRAGGKVVGGGVGLKKGWIDRDGNGVGMRLTLHRLKPCTNPSPALTDLLTALQDRKSVFLAG